MSNVNLECSLIVDIFCSISWKLSIIRICRNWLFCSWLSKEKYDTKQNIPFVFLFLFNVDRVRVKLSPGRGLCVHFIMVSLKPHDKNIIAPHNGVHSYFKCFIFKKPPFHGALFFCFGTPCILECCCIFIVLAY